RACESRSEAHRALPDEDPEERAATGAAHGLRDAAGYHAEASVARTNKTLTTEGTEEHRGESKICVGFPLCTSVTFAVMPFDGSPGKVRRQCPWSSRNFSTSSAAMQPEPAAVMAWRERRFCPSPHAKTTGTLLITVFF